MEVVQGRFRIGWLRVVAKQRYLLPGYRPHVLDPNNESLKKSKS